MHIDMLTKALMPSFAAPHCSEGACGSSSGVTRLGLANIGCLLPSKGSLLQPITLGSAQHQMGSAQHQIVEAFLCLVDCGIVGRM